MTGTRKLLSFVELYLIHTFVEKITSIFDPSDATSRWRLVQHRHILAAFSGPKELLTDVRRRFSPQPSVVFFSVLMA
jgi:hypothetical protein